MLDFVLSLSPVGPPALVRSPLLSRSSKLLRSNASVFLLSTFFEQTLAAIASMADLPDAAEGQIARVITWSYGVTPFIALSVSGSLWAVEKSGVRPK